MRRFSFFFASLIALIFPALALAHESWFVTNPAPQSGIFSTWTVVNASMVLAAFFALASGILFHLSFSKHASVVSFGTFAERYAPWGPSLLRTLTGLLLFTATFQGFLFAPDLRSDILPVGIERVVVTLQMLIGLMLVIGVAPRFISALGLVLYSLGLYVFPAASILSYLHIPGAFIYLMMIGDPSLPKEVNSDGFLIKDLLADLTKLKGYAVPLLRIFTGASFVFVGFYYKILHPEYALEFLKMNTINFMPSMGAARFSDAMFVGAAGIVEILLGVLIVLGVLPRLVALGLFGLLFVTLSLLGINELLGHLPIFAIAYILLTEGGGKKLVL